MYSTRAFWKKRPIGQVYRKGRNVVLTTRLIYYESLNFNLISILFIDHFSHVHIFYPISLTYIHNYVDILVELFVI